MKITGVIIARFQTPYLHKGHFDLINFVKEKHNKVIVVLGVSPVKASRKNPLDFYTREKMIKNEFSDIIVLPLLDSANDNTWSLNLDLLLSSTFQNEKFILYGSRDSFIPFYAGRNEVQEIPQTGDHNGTELRNQISDKVIGSEDFRSGIIYAYYNKYPTTYTTVDIVVFKAEYITILLGKRNAEGKWRLPGGFVEPKDSSLEAAAVRELHEECGMIEIGDLKYETSLKVDDWRYKNEVDKIITTIFSCKAIFGQPRAGDDLDQVEWFTLTSVKKMVEENEIIDTHLPHINFILTKYLRS